MERHKLHEVIMEIWGITDSGKVRRQNQDVFRTLFDVEKNVAVLVVCDGMGGARAGNVASALAAESFMRYMGNYIENLGEQSDVAMKMADAVIAANNAVYEKSISEDMYDGMGTTLTAVISTAHGEVVVNIGDSRVYHIASSYIKQVTTDHTVVEDMIIRGDLTRIEARWHPKKNLITRVVGTNPNEEPDVFFVSLEPGEHLLLCSDGLSNIVMESEILFEIQHSAGVRESSIKLVEMALSRGAPDNVTAVLLRK